tara:strand:- start:669 stop:1127 length:459 start_codon:yes stop_codon:yes gene_type:complete
MDYINIESIKEDIISYCKPKNDKYNDNIKTYEYIIKKLGIIYDNIHIIQNNKKLTYYDKSTYSGFDENIVWLSFPYDGICIHCSINWALSLPVAKDIMECKFKEKPITVKYYHTSFKTIMKSPIIIIMSVPIESIIFENGNNLLEFINGNSF